MAIQVIDDGPTDTERLDWLEQHALHVTTMNGPLLKIGVKVRQAIDEAMGAK